MKTMIIALSAAALIAASAVPAQGVATKTPALQHKVAKQHHRVVSGYAPQREIHAMSARRAYPGAFGYAPVEPRSLNRDLDASRQAGGGGGGGGGSGM